MAIWGSQIVVCTRGVTWGAGWASHRDRINIIGVIDDILCVRYGIIVRCLDTGSTRSMSSGRFGSCIGNAWFPPKNHPILLRCSGIFQPFQQLFNFQRLFWIYSSSLLYFLLNLCCLIVQYFPSFFKEPMTSYPFEFSIIYLYSHQIFLEEFEVFFPKNLKF